MGADRLKLVQAQNGGFGGSGYGKAVPHELRVLAVFNPFDK